MNEVNDLKDVLDRIEGKLIAASKIYSAMNFAVWGAVMLLYYVLGAFVGFGTVFTIIYWSAGAAVAFWSTSYVWSRMKALWTKDGSENGCGRSMGVLIFLSWIAGSAIGWWLIPSMVPLNCATEIGLLSFIAISVFGMWLVMELYGAKEREMLPAFLVPIAGIFSIALVQEKTMLIAGVIIALGFLLTIILYLYSAFRAIER
ncbi:MAG: hypothetical protein GXO25_00970 [Euryarchaeota archaeon]|nr:hypothetical protein [Euryarchaeota archaeon]